MRSIFLKLIVYVLGINVIYYSCRKAIMFFKLPDSSDISSNEVERFLQIWRKSYLSLEPILLEPFFLERSLREEERSLLLKHKLMPKIGTNPLLGNGVNFVTFGILNNNLTQYNVYSEAQLCPPWEGFRCLAVFRQNNLRKQTSLSTKVASHYFLLKNNCLIHLVVLFKRRHFLRIEALPQNKTKPFGIQIKDRLSFGLKEQAFDSFSLRKVLMPFYNITVSVPEESDHFLAQMNSSEFIECPLYLERKGQELPPLSLSPLALNAEKGLISMKRMMKKLKVPFWLSSGSLLGWYRECGVLGHRTDADFATWSHFANPEIAANLMNNTNGLKVIKIFGIYEDAYETTFITPDYLYIDLFHIYNESESRVKCSSHIPLQHFYLDYYYPKFELCSADLLGHKVLIPCNPEALIRADYGPNWRKPVVDWIYFKSPFNMGPQKRWPYDRIQFQEFPF